MAKPTVCDACGKDCSGSYLEVEVEGEMLTMNHAMPPKQFCSRGCISTYFSEFVGSDF